MEVQFVFYVTADALNEAGDDVSDEVKAYRDSYFTWINWYPEPPTEPAPEPPSQEAA